MTKAATYSIDAFWSCEDGAWVANVPDLEHCSATGLTPHDAVAEVGLATAAWLEAAEDAGRAIPEPSSRRTTA
jgi:predicted RNase H-like HicB family nuclease